MHTHKVWRMYINLQITDVTVSSEPDFCRCKFCVGLLFEITLVEEHALTSILKYPLST